MTRLPAAQQHFSYAIPDTVMKDILWISENATEAIEESINSSQLEGASTTRKVAKEMLRTGRDPKDHSEKMIVNNHRAMQFIRDYKDEHLTPSMVFELHRILTEGTLAPEDIKKAGAFRDSTDDICVYSLAENSRAFIRKLATARLVKLSEN